MVILAVKSSRKDVLGAAGMVSRDHKKNVIISNAASFKILVEDEGVERVAIVEEEFAS